MGDRRNEKKRRRAKRKETRDRKRANRSSRERVARWERIRVLSEAASDAPLSTMEHIPFYACAACGSSVRFAPPEMSKLILQDCGLEPIEHPTHCGDSVYRSKFGGASGVCDSCRQVVVVEPHGAFEGLF
jgi:hypothetical protein